MAGSRYAGFKAETVAFLDELSKNNNREWFKTNKARYEEQVLDVALPSFNQCRIHWRRLPLILSLSRLV